MTTRSARSTRRRWSSLASSGATPSLSSACSSHLCLCCLEGAIVTPESVRARPVWQLCTEALARRSSLMRARQEDKSADARDRHLPCSPFYLHLFTRFFTLAQSSGRSPPIRGKKRKDTVLICLSSDDVEEGKIQMNRGACLFTRRRHRRKLSSLTLYAIQSHVTTSASGSATFARFMLAQTSSTASGSTSCLLTTRSRA